MSFELSSQFSGVRVPQAHDTVIPCGGEERTRRRPRNAEYPVRVSFELSSQFSGVRVPQAHDMIPPCGGEERTRRRPRNAVYVARVSFEFEELCTAVGVPDAHRAVVAAARGDPVGLGRPRHVANCPGVSPERLPEGDGFGEVLVRACWLGSHARGVLVGRVRCDTSSAGAYAGGAPGRNAGSPPTVPEPADMPVSGDRRRVRSTAFARRVGATARH